MINLSVSGLISVVAIRMHSSKCLPCFLILHFSLSWTVAHSDSYCQILITSTTYFLMSCNYFSSHRVTQYYKNAQGSHKTHWQGMSWESLYLELWFPLMSLIQNHWNVILHHFLLWWQLLCHPACTVFTESILLFSAVTVNIDIKFHTLIFFCYSIWAHKLIRYHIINYRLTLLSWL
jgi:hypothetical protein